MNVMKHIIALFLGAALLTLAGCTSLTTTETTTNEPTALTLYTYDSLSAEYGLLPQITEQFEEDNNVELEIVSFEDTGSMLNQLLAEQDDPQADVVMGLDNVNFATVVENNLLTPYIPEAADSIAADLQFDADFTMTPFDYGYIGFVYDTEALTFDEPVSLLNLASGTYADQVIIEQPGLSSPGTQLVLWTQYGLSAANFTNFWTNLSNNVFQITPDWGTAYYNLFLEEEAPIVLSYLTSPAYHIDQEDTTRYQAVPISEGYVRQVEGVGIVNGSDNQSTSEAFVDYILSADVQNTIPTTQWMVPVLGDESTWPAAYDQVIMPDSDEVIEVPMQLEADEVESWITTVNTTLGIE